jgi:hypothetical protein
MLLCRVDHAVAISQVSGNILKMFNHARGHLSFAHENATFPGMNYRRKKVSMKEQLEEAIEEIDGETENGSGDQKAPEVRPHGIELVARPLIDRTTHRTT